MSGVRTPSLTWLSIDGYRSAVSIDLQLAPVTVVVGPNGTGKSNLYRSLVLLQSAASGTLGREFAAEGGFGSALWAGPRPKGPVRMTMKAEWDDLAYELVLGLPTPPAPFPLDPVIKSETISAGGAVLAERKGASVFVRDEDGIRQSYESEQLWASESMLSQIVDPRRLPVMADVRDRMLGWRCYHHFRTDPGAPMRAPQLGTFTPVLDSTGDDLAAAYRTIEEVGDPRGLADVIDRAFPGCAVSLQEDAQGQLLLGLSRPGLNRPLGPAELSDGTLRFLALAVAMFSPRPPGLMVLNEPETSLHEDMIPALAELIGRASARSQIWVTTHSSALADSIEARGSARIARIRMASGRTALEGAHPLGLRARP